MIEVPVDYLCPGDIIGKNHTFKRFDGGMSSTVNLMKGYRLTTRVIGKLKRDFHVEYVCILEPSELGDEVDLDQGIDEANQRRIVGDFHHCVGDIESSRVVDLSKLADVVRDIIDSVSMALRKSDAGLTTLSRTFMEVKSHDAYTWEHSVNAAIYAAMIALSSPQVLDEFRQRTSLKRFTKVEILVFNLLLHDVGKLKIPASLLNKNGPMTNAEAEQIRQHPFRGVVYLRKMNEQLVKRGQPTIPAYFMQACLYHHQAFNGSGYPAMHDGNGGLKTLSGSDIPTIGRIASVADIYDAVSSNRPYRLPYHPAESLRYLLAQRGTRLDPAITDVLAGKIRPYPRGTTVHLSSGELGVVVGAADQMGFHPIVRPIMKKIRSGGKERIIRLGHREELTLDDKSKVRIEIDPNLYHTDSPD